MAQKIKISSNRKKKNKGIVIGGTTAAVLAIVGGILYTTISDDEASNQAVNSVTMSDTTTKASQLEQPELNVELPESQATAADNEPSAEETDVVEPKQSQQETKTTEQQAEQVEQHVEEKQQAETTAIDATKYIDGQAPSTEPTYINGILLANKQYPLPKSYNPGVDPTAQKAMDEMIAAAKTAGFSLTAFSGFRSYEYQNTLYTNYVARDGQAEADRYSARPGYSEHQTGLAFDVGEVGREDVWLTEAFGETEAGKWLVQHAHEYGFILRYPKGKEHLTGFMYESWHFRYVGKDVAIAIQKQDVTLEEYLGVYQNVSSQANAASTAQQQVEETTQVGAKTNDNK